MISASIALTAFYILTADYIKQYPFFNCRFYLMEVKICFYKQANEIFFWRFGFFGSFVSLVNILSLFWRSSFNARTLPVFFDLFHKSSPAICLSIRKICDFSNCRSHCFFSVKGQEVFFFC